MRLVADPEGVGSRMGTVTSQCQGRSVTGWGWRGSPGDHSPYPRDVVPYPGDELLYCYLDIIIKYKIMRNTMNLGPAVVTTNVDEYLHELNQICDAGFILHHFTKVPSIKSTIELQDWAATHPYQAILSRPAHRPQRERWRLKIEKRLLSTRLLATAEYEEEEDLINTIHENAEKGVRLVSAQTIGYVRSGTTRNNQYVVMGVDLFFALPLHPNPVRYVYHTVRVPVRYTVVPDATQTVQQIQCDADWQGQLKLFLDNGWKLVDICIDTTALAEAFGMKDASKQVDTIWVFEKPFDKLKDTEPLYEGVILEYYHKTKRLIGTERPAKDWRPVIAGMGLWGWELATIIQTPYLAQSTFTTYTLKLLMVFQRPINHEHQRLTKDKLAELAHESFERDNLKFGAFGVTKSSSLPGSSMFGLFKPTTPNTRKHTLKPDAKLLMSASGGGFPNGHAKGAGANSSLLHPNSAITGESGSIPPLYTHTTRPPHNQPEQPSQNPTKQLSQNLDIQPLHNLNTWLPQNASLQASQNPPKQPLQNLDIQPLQNRNTWIPQNSFLQPSQNPTNQPLQNPPKQPSQNLTNQPLQNPPKQPSQNPTKEPSQKLDIQPLQNLNTWMPQNSFLQPSQNPTNQPLRKPPKQPSHNLTKEPSWNLNTWMPQSTSLQPPQNPTNQPLWNLPKQPSQNPTKQPSQNLDIQPLQNLNTWIPQNASLQPSQNSTDQPLRNPPKQPSHNPTKQPSRNLNTLIPQYSSLHPSHNPPKQPSHNPVKPSHNLHIQPLQNLNTWIPQNASLLPSWNPTNQPSQNPIKLPSRNPPMQPFVNSAMRPSRSLSGLKNYLSIDDIT